MSAVAAALNAPNIELIPGVGLSIVNVLDLACQVWTPSTGQGRTLKQVFCGYVRASSDPGARAALCAALAPASGAAEVEAELADALSFAAASVFRDVGSRLVGLGEGCFLECSTSGARVRFSTESVAEAVINFGAAMFGGDGVDVGGLLAEGVDFAVSQGICCVAALSGDLVGQALQAARYINLGGAIAQLKAQCNRVLIAGGQSAQTQAPTPGWGSAESGSDRSAWANITRASEVAQKAAKRARVVAAQQPDPPKPAPGTSPPKPAISPPSLRPASVAGPRRNWLPLALTITGAGVATILVVRRRK